MGNRGILHDKKGRLGNARWKHKSWICCQTEFEDRKRELMQPGSYTELFFWDEAAAMAAGHRPCGDCRRADFQRFKDAWAAAGLRGRTAQQIDRVLHLARVNRERKQVVHQAPLQTLPQGVFVTWLIDEDVPLLKWKGRLWRWTPEGYQDTGPSGVGMVRVLTPAPLVEVLRAGYVPQVKMP